MALVRNAANMIRKGRVGDATYYVSKGQQIVRQARNDSNYGESARRSENQQVRRVMWANLVNFYKASATWMPAAFETKKKGQTDYNKFMQVNMNGSRIALTKDQAAAGACVADAYLITQGSLPSVEIGLKGVAWFTNIGIGDLVISAATTNAELTAAMIANNANIQEGMQISFVSYQQSLDAMGMPRVICRLYEITLSRTSSDKVWDFLPEFCATSVSKMLGTSGNISEGGFAYIVSDKRAGQVRVSTQQLITKNQELISRFSSGEHVRAAMLSYGIDSEVILSPDGINLQGAEPQPNYIQAVYNSSSTEYYDSSSVIKPAGSLNGDEFVVKMANSVEGNVSKVVLAYTAIGGISTSDMSSVVTSGSSISAVVEIPESATGYLASITIVMTDGIRYVQEFSYQEDL